MAVIRRIWGNNLQLPSKQVHSSWSKVGLFSILIFRTIPHGIQVLSNDILSTFKQFSSSKLLRWLIIYRVTYILYEHCIK